MSIVIIVMSVFGAYLTGRYSAISYYENRLSKLRDDYYSLRRRHYFTVMEMEKEKQEEEERQRIKKSSVQSYWEAEDEFHINHTE